MADRAEEVARVVVALEPDDVGAEEPVEDLRTPRELRVDADRRERDVVEEADRPVGSAFPQQGRHELQLVVLHPDDAVLLDDLGDLRREALVHAL